MTRTLTEASFWRTEGDGVCCLLCPRSCFMREDQSGFCGARRAGRDGRLYTLNYGRVEALACDPIEKKPLSRFYPGTRILSAGSVGCNLSCSFCQNFAVSMEWPKEGNLSASVPPEDLARRAFEEPDNLGLAFTYNEPAVWYEYVRDTAAALKASYPEKKTVLVSNGFISAEPLAKLLPYIDAANFDLKGGERFYRTLCGASVSKDVSVLGTVENSIRAAHASGVHVELTFLLVEGENTDDATVDELLGFIESVDRAIPLHLSRYFPAYRLLRPPTPLATMRSVYRRARSVLDYVYTGNLLAEERKFVEGNGA